MQKLWPTQKSLNVPRRLFCRGWSLELSPIIAKTFPLSDIQEAHRFLETNQQFGKIVVTV